MPASNALEECRSGFKNLFQQLNIRRVISIDDVHDSNWLSDEPYIEWAANANSKDSRLTFLETLLGIRKSDGMIEEELAKWLPTPEGYTWKAENKSILKSIQGGEDFAKDTSAAKELKELFKDVGVDYIELSPDEWTKKASVFLEESLTNPVLLLFDEVLKRPNGGTDDSGTRLIEDAATAFPEANITLALVSRTITPGKENDAFVTLREKCPNKLILPIAKDEVGQPSEFGRRIKLALMGPSLQEICRFVFEEIDTAHQESSAELGKINIMDLDHIVLRKAGMEGIWEPDILLRLYGILHRHKARLKLHHNAKISQLLPKLRQLSNIPTETENTHKVLPLETWKYDRNEWYEGADYVNGCRLPIDFGDIFENSSGRRFVLVAPPCDLMVRPQTGRKKKVQEALLLGIQENLDNPDGGFMIRYTNPDNHLLTRYVNFVDAHYVKLWILDLCVFNTDGSAKWIGERPEEGELPYSWLTQFDSIAKQAGEAKTRLEAFERLQNHVKDNADLRKDLELLNSPKQPASSNQAIFEPAMNEGYLVYNFKRIDRLSPMRAHHLLSSYAAYVARSAAEVDFGTNYPGYWPEESPDIDNASGDLAMVSAGENGLVAQRIVN